MANMANMEAFALVNHDKCEENKPNNPIDVAIAVFIAIGILVSYLPQVM